MKYTVFNLKIMILKREVGIDPCYKKKKTRWKTCTCYSIALKVKKIIRWKMHLTTLANLSSFNGWLPSWLGTTQISVKSTTFYPYFGFYFHLFSCQSRDKMLQILQKFVLYPATMVANHYNQIDRPMLSSTFSTLLFLYF